MIKYKKKKKPPKFGKNLRNLKNVGIQMVNKKMKNA